MKLIRMIVEKIIMRALVLIMILIMILIFSFIPESMTQSAPSRTALATSVHSALVGLGFFCMLSNICVATMTGLPTVTEIKKKIRKK